MTARMLVDGIAGAQVSALDRGLAYGDGLFETVRMLHGAAPLWSRHMARLQVGCERLQLSVPDIARLADECATVARDLADAVVKITLTRGVGTRGYSPVGATLTRIVAAFPLPNLPADWYRDGIRVRCCGLRLAAQPRLAGIKHLNRLEQVLARAEWIDPDVVEGLLFDQDDNLVSATAANTWVGLNGRLLTPPIERCGVTGVLRAALLDVMPGVEIRAIAKDDLMRADEIFLTSSVRGVLPVRAVDERALPVGNFARAAQSHWRALGFPGGEP
ncbi:MAG TPA: aminodeoxychorismate lyase [Rhodanobacteraceae bacterium]